MREFRRLWIGQIVSQFGDALYGLLFIFMTERLTGSPAMVGYTAALQALPYLLFGPLAGVVSDRFDRRRVMVFSDLASFTVMLVMLGLVLGLGEPPVWSVFAAAFAMSTVNAFFLPAKQAAIPRLVPKDLLMAANGLSISTQNLMWMLGIAMSAGVLGIIEKVRPEYLFATAIGANMVTFLVSAAIISGLPAIRPLSEEAHESAWVSLRAGLKVIGEMPVLKVILVLSLAMNLFISPFMVVYVEANKEWFGGTFQKLAFIELAFFLGMVLVGLVIARLNLRRPGIAYSWGLFVVGLTVVLMGIWPQYWAFWTWNFLAGLALPFAIVPISTYVQTVVPDAFLGRVNSALTIAGQAAQPIGMVAAGGLLEALGLIPMFWLMGGGMALCALAGMLSPAFRQARLEG